MITIKIILLIICAINAALAVISAIKATKNYNELKQLYEEIYGKKYERKRKRHE